MKSNFHVINYEKLGSITGGFCYYYIGEDGPDLITTTNEEGRWASIFLEYLKRRQEELDPDRIAEFLESKGFKKDVRRFNSKADLFSFLESNFDNAIGFLKFLVLTLEE